MSNTHFQSLSVGLIIASTLIVGSVASAETPREALDAAIGEAQKTLEQIDFGGDAAAQQAKLAGLFARIAKCEVNLLRDIKKALLNFLNGSDAIYGPLRDLMNKTGALTAREDFFREIAKRLFGGAIKKDLENADSLGLFSSLENTLAQDWYPNRDASDVIKKMFDPLWDEALAGTAGKGEPWAAAVRQLALVRKLLAQMANIRVLHAKAYPAKSIPPSPAPGPTPTPPKVPAPPQSPAVLSPQMTPHILRALFKAASAASFTSARRVKAPDEKDMAKAAEMLARDVETVLRSVNVIETLRAEKDGVLGAARTVSSPEFVAKELMGQFAPKPAPAKRASALDGVVAVANAGDIPTDAEIKEAGAKVKDAESKVYDARVAAGKAKGSDADAAKAELAKAREALDKAKAKVGELSFKKGIAESVSNCTFNANTRYGIAQSYAAQPIVNMMLLRVGELIGNPYLPELGRFGSDIKRGQNGNLSPDEITASKNAKDGKDMLEAQFLFKLAQTLEAAGRGGNVKTDMRPIRRAFEEAIRTDNPLDLIWKILGPMAKREFEEKGILNTGGLVDAIDDFLEIQRLLLGEDIASLKKLIDGMKADIKKEVQKLEATLDRAERQLGRDLGDIGMGSSDMEAQLDAVMAAYLDCTRDRLGDLLYFVKSHIYNKIYDAVKNAVLDAMKGVKNATLDAINAGRSVLPVVVRSGLINGTDVVVGNTFKNVHVAFRDAVSGDNLALGGLQKAVTDAVDASDDYNFLEKPFEGAKRRLMLRFSILLLRNVEDYAAVQDKTLKVAWGRTLNTMVETDGAEVRGILDQVKFLSENPDIIALRTLLYAIDEFVRRFKEIIAGIEGLPQTGIKPKYCALEQRIEEKEKQKEEAMKEIEKKGEEAKKQVGQAPASDNCGGLGFKDRMWSIPDGAPSCPSIETSCPAGNPSDRCSTSVAYQAGACIPDPNNPGSEGYYVIQKVVTRPTGSPPYYNSEFHNVYACATTNRNCPPPTLDCGVTLPSSPQIYR